MEIIKSRNKMIDTIVGKQPYYKNLAYNPIAYQRAVELDEYGSMLIENTLTRQIIKISKEEYERPPDNIRKFLVENWYLLQEGTSEKTLSYCVNASCRSRHFQKPENMIDAYTIFTTLKCNARCLYCYEKGREQNVMTPEIAKQVACFIESNHGSMPVNIGWFGGEPLLNTMVIDQICQYMKINRIPYTSTMISNGFLFKGLTAEQILDCWHLKQVQITLDGTEANYNQIKGYVCLQKGESAFQQVIDNIKMLTDIGVHVTIRMNESQENYKDLIELAEFLATKFKGNRNLTAYAHPLFEDESNILSSENWKGVYRGYIELDKTLKSLGLRSWQGVDSIVQNHCMADSGHHVCISPEGNLTLCEHYSDSEIVGDIWNGITDDELVETWRELDDERDECQKCWRYPKCFRLKKCEVRNDCFHGMDKFWEYQEDESIRKIYEHYLKQRNAVSVRMEKQEIKARYDPQVVINIAQNQIGKGLQERNFWTESFPGLRVRGWCLAFLYAIYKEAYGDGSYKKILRVGDSEELIPYPHLCARKFRETQMLFESPEVGDLVFYASGNWIDHVGIVVSVLENGEYFDSVEGSVLKDGFRRVCQMKHIPVKDNKCLVGFGRPDY